MAKASGSIDLNAMKEASKVATNCITEISNAGIWVTPSGKKPNSNGEPITTGSESSRTTGTLIDNTGVNIYKNGIKLAQYGTDIRLYKPGDITNPAVLINSDEAIFTGSINATSGSFGSTNGYYKIDYDGLVGYRIGTVYYFKMIEILANQEYDEGSVEATSLSLETSILSYSYSDILAIDVVNGIGLKNEDDKLFIILKTNSTTPISEIFDGTITSISCSYTYKKSGEELGGFGNVQNYTGLTTPSTENLDYVTGTELGYDYLKTDKIIASSGMDVFSKTDVGTLNLAHFGYDLGNSASGEENSAPYYTFGTRKTTTDEYSNSSTYTIGDLCIHDNKIYACIMDIRSPGEWDSYYWRLAIGNYSFAEGYDIIASASYSHGEGYDTKASGSYSHAEGYQTHAGYPMSHAEGWGTLTQGIGSHAGGRGTVAIGDYQTVIGRYNKFLDNNNVLSNYAFMIGNGTGNEADERSNALMVDWNGQVLCQGVSCKNGGYHKFFVGNMTSRAKQINGSLGNNSTQEDWLTATIKAICIDYPGKNNAIFEGLLQPGSLGRFWICIYNTSDVTGNLPRYSFGEWRAWSNHFRKIWTNNYVFYNEVIGNQS